MLKPQQRQRPLGRRTKLTPELIDQWEAALSQGYFVKEVCELLGIGESTFHRWIQQGEAGKAGLVQEFYERTRKARGWAAMQLTDKIAQAQDWRAQAWLLERLFPDEYGPTRSRLRTRGFHPPAAESKKAVFEVNVMYEMGRQLS